MPRFPTAPDEPIQLTITSTQAFALCDAITCLGLAVDGELETIRELYVPPTGPDTAEAARYVRSVVADAYEVHDMISEAQRPRIREVGRWVRQVKRWHGSHGGRLRGV